MTGEAPGQREIAAAKLNLALHVRGKLPDGRHAIETLFAFCTDGDRLEGWEDEQVRVETTGQFASEVPADLNLALKAAQLMRERRGADAADGGGARIVLKKRLPVAAGLGGGSADAAATLRLLTALWSMDPKIAEELAPQLGSDVPACLLSLPCRGEGAGDALTPVSLPEIAGKPVLLVNPRVQLSTADVFAGWDGNDEGPLGDWRIGRNDLQSSAIALVPQIETVLAWLSAQRGAEFVRMSGSGATCFAIFESVEDCARSAEAVPREWWHLETSLR